MVDIYSLSIAEIVKDFANMSKSISIICYMNKWNKNMALTMIFFTKMSLILTHLTFKQIINKTIYMPSCHLKQASMWIFDKNLILKLFLNTSVIMTQYLTLLIRLTCLRYSDIQCWHIIDTLPFLSYIGHIQRTDTMGNFTWSQFLTLYFGFLGIFCN